MEKRVTYKERFGYPNNKQRRDNYFLLRANGFNPAVSQRVRDFKQNHLLTFIMYNIEYTSKEK
jgi:hypothetical protein